MTDATHSHRRPKATAEPTRHAKRSSTAIVMAPPSAAPVYDCTKTTTLTFTTIASGASVVLYLPDQPGAATFGAPPSQTSSITDAPIPPFATQSPAAAPTAAINELVITYAVAVIEDVVGSTEQVITLQPGLRTTYIPSVVAQSTAVTAPAIPKYATSGILHLGSQTQQTALASSSSTGPLCPSSQPPIATEPSASVLVPADASVVGFGWPSWTSSQHAAFIALLVVALLMLAAMTSVLVVYRRRLLRREADLCIKQEMQRQVSQQREVEEWEWESKICREREMTLLQYLTVLEKAAGTYVPPQKPVSIKSVVFSESR